MKSLLGIGLVLLAIAGGRLIASSLDHAIDAPRARFDATADAHIEQIRREGAERIAREQAEDMRRLENLMAALRTK